MPASYLLQLDQSRLVPCASGEPDPVTAVKASCGVGRIKEGANMTELNKTEARQGETHHRQRYVLGISLALVIVVMAVVYISYAA